LGRDALPENVQTLVAEHLQSSADIDVLLLLHRHRDRHWSALGVAGELRLHVDQTQAILNRLAESGLLRAEGGGFVCAPRTAALAEAVDAVARLHPTYRLALTRLILSAGADTGPGDQPPTHGSA